jgi:hypothetical protein
MKDIAISFAVATALVAFVAAAIAFPLLAGVTFCIVMFASVWAVSWVFVCMWRGTDDPLWWSGP